MTAGGLEVLDLHQRFGDIVALDVALSVGASGARAEVERTRHPTLQAALQATVDSAHLRKALVYATGLIQGGARIGWREALRGGSPRA